MRKIIMGIMACLLLTAATVYWWSNQPFRLSQQVVDVTVKPGDGIHDISQQAVRAGVNAPSWLLGWWLRLAGDPSRFKAGTYEIRTGDTPAVLLRRLSRGELAMRKVRLAEGWTFRQVRAALVKGEALRQDSASMDVTELMRALGRPGENPEGLFFPDTYKYAKNTSDLDILKLAMRTMDRKLDAAWQARDPSLPLQSPYELLKLASIVEKETGLSADRGKVAAVFANRLRIGMRLQTDPTVIYGLGEQFDGDLRRRDLQTDTPYNTYTRTGLPPTPIAMPSEASLAAAANPADSKALYFVSRGDGSSEFSETLDAHNRAVNKYIRGKP